MEASTQTRHNRILGPIIRGGEFAMRSMALGVEIGSAAQEYWLNTAEGMGMPHAIADLGHRTVRANVELTELMTTTYGKPEFNIPGLTPEVAMERPFMDLLYFRSDGRPKGTQPKMLLVAPLSGHYATLLRPTVEEFSKNHDVYLTEWKNAKDVPLSEGRFGIDEYTDYCVDSIIELGSDTHVVCVCQSGVEGVMAVSRIAEISPDDQPASLTLMASPIDSREGELTDVQEVADKYSIKQFGRYVIAKVGGMNSGAGRLVYPGRVQLMSFMSMNPQRHQEQLAKFWEDRVIGNSEAAAANKSFYEEYFALLDIPAEFYLETVRDVFQEQKLARGVMEYHGQIVDPGAVTRTKLFTVEGERDDICPPGQTVVAHELFKGLKRSRKAHMIQPDVGHYGVFSGSRFRERIAPRISGMTHAA